MSKPVNLVDLVKSFQTNIYLQNLASIQKRTSPMKFAHLAEKCEKGSVSNLSTKRATDCCKLGEQQVDRANGQLPRQFRPLATSLAAPTSHPSPGGSVHGERANFTGHVLGCIETKFCNKYSLKSSRRDLHNALLKGPLHRFSNRKILTKFYQYFRKKCTFGAVLRSALCRSRREPSNAYLLAKFGFDTAENEPFTIGQHLW